MPYPVCLASWAFRIQNGAVRFHIADIKQLVMIKPMLTSSGNIRLHIVQFTEFLGEVNVPLVSEACASENNDTILYTVSHVGKMKPDIKLVGIEYFGNSLVDLFEHFVAQRNRKVYSANLGAKCWM